MTKTKQTEEKTEIKEIAMVLFLLFALMVVAVIICIALYALVDYINNKTLEPTYKPVCEKAELYYDFDSNVCYKYVGDAIVRYKIVYINDSFKIDATPLLETTR